MALSLTTEQFEELLSTVAKPETSTGSFSRCTARFNGKRCAATVETFITATSVYKDIEKINDADALKGFPLLLTDSAATWWQGVKSEAQEWEDAVNLLRNAFSPAKPPHQIYVELFQNRQKAKEPIHEFLCRARALLSQLPANRHDEETQLDLIYGLLIVTIRKKVPRDQIRTFADLAHKARYVEQIEEETISSRNEKPTYKNMNIRCRFCHFKGHSMEDCRKRKTEIAKPEAAVRQDSRNVVKNESRAPTITCYGCGTPGYFRRNCPNCSPKDNNVTTQAVHFYSIHALTQFTTQVPTIPVTICGISGQAHIDTAAKTSVAGATLYELLRQQRDCKFHAREVDITFADGQQQQKKEVFTTMVKIELGGKTFDIDFVILPEAEDNRTLLGIDFLEKAAIVLNIPQRCWHFADTPWKRQTFIQMENGRTPEFLNKPRTPQKPKNITTVCSTDVRTPGSPFLEFFASPIPECEEETDSIPYRLHAMETPPRPYQGATTDNYSPGAIYNIFKDTLPETYTPPKTDPRRKRPKVSLFSVDFLIQPTETPDLDNQQIRRLNDLLHEFRDLFQSNGPPTQYIEHRINTENHAPIASAPYRLNATRQAILREKLDDMLEKGIIEESDTPWVSPVVLVPKKDDDIRVCIDYRRLNAITIPDRYPLSRIDDLLHAAKGHPFMTSLDLQSGYWQIKVYEDDQDKTGFITPFGIYRFVRMPFGLRNAPSTFQRLMDRFRVTLQDVSVHTYLDDLIVRSPTFDQHIQDLGTVFEHLRHHHLRINRKKCSFGCATIKYLGHLITKEGICVDPGKINCILQLPRPTNLKQLLTFIQTCSWYRRFIPNFSSIARPLTNLTKRKAAWTWELKEQDAYDKLKECLTTSPVLKQADDLQPFIIKTDASGYAIGAVLVQGEGAEEHPIEYASGLLTDAERNYSTTEREALAIFWAINKFRGYIEGSESILITDHQPLRWLMNLKTPTGRLARWALQLQPYNLKVVYAPGKTNVVADFLSRPTGQPTEADCDLFNIEIDLPRRGEKDLREKQLDDPELRVIIEALEDSGNDEINRKWFSRGYLLQKGVLYRYTDDQEDEDARWSRRGKMSTDCQ